MTWLDDAACIGTIPEIWVFYRPSRNPARPTPAEQVALNICATCPVTRECLQDELDWMAEGHMSFGVRGGTIPPQRQDILNNRHRVTTARGAA